MLLNDFTRWAIDRRILFSGVRAEERTAGRGLYATQPLRIGDSLASVPRAAVLAVECDERSAGGVPTEV